MRDDGFFAQLHLRFRDTSSVALRFCFVRERKGTRHRGIVREPLSMSLDDGSTFLRRFFRRGKCLGFSRARMRHGLFPTLWKRDEFKALLASLTAIVE